MSDLISRQEAIDAINQWIEMDKYYHPYSKGKTILVSEAIDEIQRLPSAQKTGKWVQKTFTYRCSACQEDSEWPSEYCPWCGARMVGEEE